jgi:hypothetical protein
MHQVPAAAPPAVPAAASPKRQLVLLDVLSTRATVLAGVGFFAALALLVIIGAVGPLAVKWSEQTVAPACADPTSCLVTGTFAVTLTPYNQAVWLLARIQRPTNPATNELLSPSLSLSWPQNYTVSVVGDGVLLTDAAPHTNTVTCPPNQAACSPLFVFAESHLTRSNYVATISMFAPTRLFPVIPGASVQVVLRMGTIDPAYTSFQVGWKSTFCVFSALLLAYYSARVGGLLGKGARSAASGERLTTTTAQKWVAVLGVLLFFFNDPSYLSYVTKPDLGVSGFYAVCSTTFLAALLLYWLVTFDLARLQGEQGLAYSVEDEEDPRRRPGACFWVPKILLIAAFWTISIASYMYARFMQASDPSFSVVETVGGGVAAWFATFIAGLLAVYVLYAFGLLVLCFRLFATLRAPSRFVVAVTVTALLFTLVGLFLGSVTALRETSALYLASFGSANVYVGTLMLLHLPAEAAASAGAGAQAQAAAGGVREWAASPRSWFGGARRVPEESSAATAAAAAAAASASAPQAEGSASPSHRRPESFTDEATEDEPHALPPRAAEPVRAKDVAVDVAGSAAGLPAAKPRSARFQPRSPREQLPREQPVPDPFGAEVE